MSRYPTFEELKLKPNQNELLVVRRSLMSLLPLIWLFIFTVLVAVTFLYLSKTSLFYSKFLYFIKPSVVAVIPLLALVEIIRRLYNDVYLIGVNRLVHKKGRLSFAYNVPVVRFEDIRAVNVVQDFWGRILGYGDILVGTSAQLGNEIIISGVKHPDQT
jgi:hypothetical protein